MDFLKAAGTLGSPRYRFFRGFQVLVVRDIIQYRPGSGGGGDGGGGGGGGEEPNEHERERGGEGAFSGDCPSPSLEPPLPCLQSCLLSSLPSPRSPLSRGTTSLPSAIHPTVCTLIVASLRKCSPFTQCHHLALFGHRSLICFLANISIFFYVQFYCIVQQK